MVDKMCHDLPQHSFVGIALGGYVFEFSVEPFIGQICHKFHQSGFLVCPPSPQRFEGWEILWFPNRILRDSLPALAPDPSSKQGMDKGATQASIWEGRG